MPSSNSTKILQNSLHHRCSQECKGECPYKHNVVLRKKNTDDKLTMTCVKPQKQSKSGKQSICKNYLENRCRRSNCRLIHNDYLRIQFVERAKSHIYNALAELGLSNGVTSTTNYCYYYSTGVLCARHVVPNKCPFQHNLEVRRAVLKALNGEYMSDSIIALSQGKKEKGTLAVTPGRKVSSHSHSLSPSSSFCMTKSQTTFSSPPSPQRQKFPTSHHDDTLDVSKELAMVAGPVKGVLATQGDWEKPHWWKWGLANISTYKCARYFGQYIDGLEAGKSPHALISSFGKKAPSDSAFKYFTLFPYEIRHMIWRLAVKAQKTELRLQFSHDVEFGRKTNIKLRNLNCSPSLLHVNAESRAYALKHYQILFGTKHNPARIFLNPHRDRVFFQTKDPYELSEMARYISGYDASRIRHLILPLRDFVKGDEMVVSDTLPYFVNTRKLTLIYGLGRQDLKILTPSELRYHKNGITACLQSSWARKLPGKPPPALAFQQIHEITAHYYGIDGIAF